MSNESGCGCGHCHEHEHREIETCGCGHCHEKEENKAIPIAITVIGALLIAATFLPLVNEFAEKILLISSALLCGFPIFINAFRSLKKLKINESVLLVIAVAAAIFLGEFFEAAMVSVLFRIGELMEDFASDRSRKSIEAIFSIVSDEANLITDGGKIRKIDADEVKIGDILAVMPHEIFPVDGVVVKGEGSVDASALTGESLPVEISESSKISSGMINGNSTVHIRATAVKNQSSAARIVEMVSGKEYGHYLKENIFYDFYLFSLSFFRY